MRDLGQYNLSQFYRLGKGVPENLNEAFKWSKKAADQGYTSAQNNLGAMYDNGFGVPENDAEAVNWYRRAAQLWHRVLMGILIKYW